MMRVFSLVQFVGLISDDFTLLSFETQGSHHAQTAAAPTFGLPFSIDLRFVLDSAFFCLRILLSSIHQRLRIGCEHLITRRNSKLITNEKFQIMDPILWADTHWNWMTNRVDCKNGECSTIQMKWFTLNLNCQPIHVKCRVIIPILAMIQLSLPSSSSHLITPRVSGTQP